MSKFQKAEFDDLLFSDGQEGVIELNNHEYINLLAAPQASHELNYNTIDSLKTRTIINNPGTNGVF